MFQRAHQARDVSDDFIMGLFCRLDSREILRSVGKLERDVAKEGYFRQIRGTNGNCARFLSLGNIFFCVFTSAEKNGYQYFDGCKGHVRKESEFHVETGVEIRAVVHRLRMEKEKKENSA